MENYDVYKEELSKILKSLADKDPFWAWDKKYFPQCKEYLKRLKELTKILYKENRKIIYDVLQELTKNSTFNYFKFWEDCLKWPKMIPVIHLKNKMPKYNVEYHLPTDFTRLPLNDSEIYKGYIENNTFVLEIAYIYKWDEDGKRGWDQLARRSKLIFYDVKNVFFFNWKNYVSIQSRKTNFSRLKGNTIYGSYEVPFTETQMIEQGFKFLDKIEYDFVNYRFFYFLLGDDIYRMGIIAKDWKLKQGEKIGSLSYAIRPNRP